MLIETRRLTLEVTRAAGWSLAVYVRLGTREFYWSRDQGVCAD